MSKLRQPLMTNRFRIQFLDGTGMKLSYSDVLSQQVIKTTLYSVPPDSTDGELGIVFEEDAGKELMNALTALAEEVGFSIIIQYLDGNDQIIRTAAFDECFLMQIIYGGMDYTATEAVSQAVIFNFDNFHISFT